MKYFRLNTAFLFDIFPPKAFALASYTEIRQRKKSLPVMWGNVFVALDDCRSLLFSSSQQGSTFHGVASARTGTQGRARRHSGCGALLQQFVHSSH
jgi:hypothetical protein